MRLPITARYVFAPVSLLVACASAPGPAARDPAPPRESKEAVVQVPRETELKEDGEIVKTVEAPPRSDAECPPRGVGMEAKEPERIAAAHILIQYRGAKRARKETVRSKEQARSLAERLLAELCAGADFAAMAAEYSDEPGSGERGGSLGHFRRGMMVKPFEQAAFSLGVGEFSGVVESEFGFHLVRRSE
ncbi:MAG: peptidylprolyl isomerase [Polyangiaceae bacterium]